MKTRQRLSLLISVAMAAASCGGVKIPGADSATTSGGDGAKSSSPVQPSNDAREDVKKAWEKFYAAKSFRGRMSGATTSSGVAIGGGALEIEFVAPDRYHWSAQGKGERGEIIFIGKDMYARKGDGAWMKGQGAFGEALIKQFRDSLELRMARYEEIKFTGTDTVDGSPMLVYQYQLKDDPATGKGGPGKLWVGASDGLPHQVETEIKGGKVYFTYYDYNADIKVEPPI